MSIDDQQQPGGARAAGKPTKAQRFVLDRLFDDGFIVKREFRKGTSAGLFWGSHRRVVPSPTFRVLCREGWIASAEGDAWRTWPIYRITSAGRAAAELEQAGDEGE